MRVNLKLDVPDAARNALAVALAGKPVKRLATREEIASFVSGMIEGMAEPAPVPRPLALPEVEVAVGIRSPYTPEELKVAARLAAEGRNADYIRGWISVGRTLARSKGGQ